jgi:hypothetical protein
MICIPLLRTISITPMVLRFFYRFLTRNDDDKANKKIVEIRSGQYIFNPNFINKGAVAVIDRPFSGYLFGGLEKDCFFIMKRFLKVGLTWVLWDQILLQKKHKKDFINFSVIKESTAGNPKLVMR